MVRKLIKRHEFFLCLFLGFTFLGSGMAKLYADHAYFGWIGPIWLEERLEPHGLGLYARFIAYSQVLIGYMLFTYRYRVLGAIMAVPLIGNILMVTISMQWQGTPYIRGFLFVMTAYILFRNLNLLIPIVGFEGGKAQVLNGRNTVIWIIGLTINVASIQLSQFSITLAWSASILGLAISFYANYLEGKRAH